MNVLLAVFMDFISSYQKTVYQGLMSYMVGRLLIIFFKRRFSFKVHTRKDLLDVLPAFVGSFLVKRGPIGTILGLVSLLCSNTLHWKDEMIKTLFIWASVHIAFYAQLSESTFACLALALGTTQFLRKPDKLKLLLREPRVIFGPIYVLMVCAGLRFSSIQAPDLASLLTGTASLLSVLAAVFFRPDNNETMRLVLPESKIPTTYRRQIIHGALLFAGYLLMFGKALYLDPLSSCKMAAAFGVLNVVLYSSYKISRVWR